MKKFTLIICVIIAMLFTSCHTEKLEESARGKSHTSVIIPTNYDLEELGEECISVNLIAGQHHDAGSVTVYNDGENLIIVYSSNDDWTIDLTHLSVGNCNEDWVPLTGSGNPQIGQFQYTEPVSISEHEVIYVISLEDLNDHICFTAHAEVEGPTGGETAWAEGPSFDGNNWAMYVEALLSDCEPEDDNGPF